MRLRTSRRDQVIATKGKANEPNKERIKSEFHQRCKLLKIPDEIHESAGRSLSAVDSHDVRLAIRLYRLTRDQFDKIDGVTPVEERVYPIENTKKPGEFREFRSNRN